MTLTSDVQKSWHDGLVELFEIDLEPITKNAADKFYFANQIKPDGQKIQWKGKVYEPLPLVSTGYERNSSGQIPQPTLTVANILGTFSNVIEPLDDLVGAKITRRRTLAKYLDGEPSANPNQEFPDDIYYIEQKTGETELTITWQLASVLDLEGLQLPRRVITQNFCKWKYRGSECGYTGGPVADERDRPTSNSAADVCGKRLRSCQLRFPNQSLPFGGFPGANTSR
jgi:lambda family phage minor tail protein L